MKKLFTFLSAVMVTAGVFAQAPQKMSYQAVIRDINGNLVTNHAVGMKISILLNSTSVYVETQSATTNANGLITLEIGAGNVVTGAISSIAWAIGSYFIKTEVDPTGGTNYSISGTSQLLSVPYALHSKTVETYSDIVPRIAEKGQRLSVSFSGGDSLTFSQSSSTCPNIYANVILKFIQGTSTIQINPTDTYYINSKRFDAVFDIPSYVPSGIYDIILGPSTTCPHTFNTSFKIH